jgi:5-methyltetrahydrofolate--homocysteine methyltransferase
VLIIAERINATRTGIAQALQRRDAELIAREARRQAEAGAHFIDVNAASDPERELEDLEWALGIVQAETELPVCLDSANPEALQRGLERVQGDAVMLNSVTAEQEKLEAVLPLAAESGALLVALAMDEGGVPKTADERVSIAARLIEAAESAGVPRQRVYVDPCVQPISTDIGQGLEVISAVWRIMEAFEGVHTTCGLSNVSFGLPRRGLLNRTFLACLIAAGLDAAICDPTEPGLIEAVRAAEALVGRDDYCIDYIRTMREAAK